MTVKATKLINIDSLKTFKDKLDEAHSSLINTRITNDQTNRISSITVDSTTKLPSAASMVTGNLYYVADGTTVTLYFKDSEGNVYQNASAAVEEATGDDINNLFN